MRGEGVQAAISMAVYNDLDTVPAITCKGDFTALECPHGIALCWVVSLGMSDAAYKPPDGSQYVADVRPELMK